MRVRWRDFSKGVFATGSREAIPQGFARRLKGFAGSISGDYLRPRFRHEARVITETGSTVHSIARLGNFLYYGMERGFGYSTPGDPGGIADTGATIYSNLSRFLSGNQLTFVTGKPVAGQGNSDFLFCCGGDLVFKTRQGNSGFSRWGIAAPTEPISGGEYGPVSGETYFRPNLFNFDNLAPWTQVVNASITLVQDNFNVPGGERQDGNSLNVQVSADTTGKALGVFSLAGDGIVNFSQFGTNFKSSDQDWIVLDVKVLNVANLDQIQLFFYNDPSDNNQSALTFTLVADDPLQRDLTSGANGLGDITEIADDETGFLTTPPTASSGTSKDIVERMAVIKLAGTDGTWTRLKIPKSAFTYSQPTLIGQTSAWSHITAFEAVITTNKGTMGGGGVNVRFNNGAMFGGAGMQGHYKYCYTIKDPGTKHRSNPSPIFEVDTIFRSGVRLSVPLAPTNDPDSASRAQLPLSTTGQQMIRELWRTFGNGSVFFKCAEFGQNIPSGGSASTQVLDRVADWQGLHDLPVQPSLYLGTGFFANGVLDPNSVLTFDNIAPGHYFQDAFGLAYGRMWWTRDTDPNAGAGGRVYYSPPGRLESVAGFIEVAGTTTDQMQKGVIWNGIYVFSQRRLFEVVGTDEPFGSREILGVPGTLWPHTVVPTPYGIIYEALDGIRVFDGSGSQLLPLPPVEVFFRRDTNARTEAGFTSAYQTTLNHYACFFNDEYRWSDGTTGLAFNLRTGAWRVMDAPPTGWLADTQGECYGGGVGLIKSWEFGSIGGDYAANPNSTTGIDYEFETPGAIVDGRDTFLVQRVYLDVALDTSSGHDTMQAYLITGDDVPGSGPTAQLIGTVTPVGAARQLIEMNVGCAYVSVPGVRLTGQAGQTGSLRIHGVELDVHVPEQPGEGT